jgi:hypothetical protein
MGSMSLSLMNCDGGVVLDWSKFASERFNHYTVLRSSSSSIPLTYPPQAGAVDVETTYTTDAFKSDSFDAGAEAGATAYYRAMAFDSEDRVIATSAVSDPVVPKAVRSLGGLAVSQPGGAGAETEFGWTSYSGSSACFSFYKLVGSKTNPEPSYLGGDGIDVAIPISEQFATSASFNGLEIEPGTYWFRLQAIRATSLGKFIVAETGVTQFTIAP